MNAPFRPPLRIMVVVGTRPEAIKLFPVIHALRDDHRFAPTICVTGQHRALLDQVLKVTGIVPDHDLDVMGTGHGLDGLTSALLTRLGAVIDEVRPHRVMVQGDTMSAMAGAFAAHHRLTPVDHVEAGLRSGSLSHPWPEEGNRRIISALADQHFAPTDTAAKALLAENHDPARIHVTGNTGIDALRAMAARVRAEPALAAGLDPLLARFAGRRIIAVTTHRRENFGAGMNAIADAIARLARRPDVAVVLPVHPNPQVRPVLDAALGSLGNVALIEPLDYPHFARLLGLAHVVLTDSGGVQEEAPALGRPVLVLRETTERPEGIAAGTARLVGTDADAIVRETTRLLDDPDAHAVMARAHNPYGDGKAAPRIVEAIASTGVQIPAYQA